MANLSQQKREKMLAFLEQLKQKHPDDETVIAINAIENELTHKKYGLVWEEHSENVDEVLKSHIPVLIENRAHKILAGQDRIGSDRIGSDRIGSAVIVPLLIS